MAVVHCNNAHGLVLRLHEFFEPVPGVRESRPKGAAVELRPGRNEVDDTFWAEWLSAHKDDEIVTAGVVHVEESAKKD